MQILKSRGLSLRKIMKKWLIFTTKWLFLMHSKMPNIFSFRLASSRLNYFNQNFHNLLILGNLCRNNNFTPTFTYTTWWFSGSWMCPCSTQGGSRKCSKRQSLRHSVSLSNRFLGIKLLVFSKFWHGVRMR